MFKNIINKNIENAQARLSWKRGCALKKTLKSSPLCCSECFESRRLSPQIGIQAISVMPEKRSVSIFRQFALCSAKGEALKPETFRSDPGQEDGNHKSPPPAGTTPGGVNRPSPIFSRGDALQHKTDLIGEEG
jgi:hypothetical protein